MSGTKAHAQIRKAGSRQVAGATGRVLPAVPTVARTNFKLVGFADLHPGPEPLYLVDELFPVAGLVDVWGKAKCYKSFWTLDLCCTSLWAGNIATIRSTGTCRLLRL